MKINEEEEELIEGNIELEEDELSNDVDKGLVDYDQSTEIYVPQAGEEGETALEPRSNDPVINAKYEDLFMGMIDEHIRKNNKEDIILVESANISSAHSLSIDGMQSISSGKGCIEMPLEEKEEDKEDSNDPFDIPEK